MEKRFLFFVALMLCLASTLIYADEYFTIDHYQVNMNVLKNNSYEITEIIDVNFKTHRHGIYKKIPATFDNMPVVISGIMVPGYNITLEHKSDFTTIKIGSVDKYVNGKVRYTISYIYNVGADNFTDKDIFSFDIIDPQWDTTINSVNFQIAMPKEFDKSKIEFTSGKTDLKNGSALKWLIEGNTITGESTKILNNYDDLTITLPLPEGYWTGAEKHRPKGYLLFSILGYPLFLLVLAGSFILWLFLGRDKKITPKTEFNAPEGMTPAEIGYVITGKVDDRDITSLIIFWASKGFLNIKEEKTAKGLSKKTDITLSKIKEL
ncbi:MAG: DUF2207 domain-containing protein, partial [Spirochaetales bacterium]|nr:DUF2207 domain-containing protein [Spirochaetales bacterium]